MVWSLRSRGVAGYQALTAYLFIAVPLAAHAVPVLADAGLRCAPRLRFASLHAEGDGGYLQGVLSFGQPGIVRQLVLRAGSRCKEYRSYGKKYLNGMSFLHIALFFVLVSCCRRLRRRPSHHNSSMGSSGLTLAPGQRCVGQMFTLTFSFTLSHALIEAFTITSLWLMVIS